MNYLPDATGRLVPLRVKMPTTQGVGPTRADGITTAPLGRRLVARIARLNVVDHDPDVVMSGSVGSQDVVLSAWQHDSMRDRLPVGKGTVSEEGDALILRGHYFDTAAGRATYETVKAMGQTEWSWGYNALRSHPGTKDGVRVRFLDALDVFEASAVLRGASIGTRLLELEGLSKTQLTVAAGMHANANEGARQAPAHRPRRPSRHGTGMQAGRPARGTAGLEMTDDAAAVAPYGAALRFARSTAARIAERTRARIEMRAEVGRELSAENRTELLELAGDLESIGKDLRRMARPRAAACARVERIVSAPPWVTS
jgi:hypothetical protein